MSSRCVVAVACTVFTAIALSPRPVQACGGFFCNNAAPVDQTGEEILFAVEDGRIEAHVLIAYEGPGDAFAWVVPTPSAPEIDVSSARIFDILDRVVGPRFVLQNWQPWGGWCDPETGDGTMSEPPRDPDGVEVVERRIVGPFDAVVLRATDIDALVAWLAANDYDIPEVAASLLEPYVVAGGGTHFVAPAAIARGLGGAEDAGSECVSVSRGRRGIGAGGLVLLVLRQCCRGRHPHAAGAPHARSGA